MNWEAIVSGINRSPMTSHPRNHFRRSAAMAEITCTPEDFSQVRIISEDQPLYL